MLQGSFDGMTSGPYTGRQLDVTFHDNDTITWQTDRGTETSTTEHFARRCLAAPGAAAGDLTFTPRPGQEGVRGPVRLIGQPESLVWGVAGYARGLAAAVTAA